MAKDTMMVFMPLLREVLFVSDLIDMKEYTFYTIIGQRWLVTSLPRPNCRNSGRQYRYVFACMECNAR